MLGNEIIESSQSDWTSPCALVDKPDGFVRFCTDYDWINAMTKTDSHSIPRDDDNIDKVREASSITKCNL